MHSKQSKAFFALLLSGFLLGTYGVWVRLLASDISAYQQILFRTSVALIIAIVFVSCRRIPFTTNGVPLRDVLLYGISFPLSIAFFTLSVLETKIAVAIFSLYCGSLLISFIAGILIFKEKISLLKCASTGFVLLGLMCFIWPFSSDSMNSGLLFGFLSGVGDGVKNSFRKYLGGKIDLYVLALIAMIGSVLMALFLVLTAGQTLAFFNDLSPRSWVVGVLFGVSIFATLYLALYGFGHFDLNLGTIVSSSELFFAPILAALIFSEIPLPNEMIGGVFVCVAIALIYWHPKRQNILQPVPVV